MLKIEHPRPLGIAELVAKFHEMPATETVVVVLLSVGDKRKQEQKDEKKKCSIPHRRFTLRFRGCKAPKSCRTSNRQDQSFEVHGTSIGLCEQGRLRFS